MAAVTFIPAIIGRLLGYKKRVTNPMPPPLVPPLPRPRP